MKKISREQVIAMHALLVEKTGGSHGLKDEKLLDSALQSPFQSFDGEDLYKSIRAKAAKLGFFLIRNHPFVDGNKRIGILVMVTFLDLNGIEIESTDESIINVGLGVADGSISDKDLLNWIIDHS